jgi:hypothetical protein
MKFFDTINNVNTNIQNNVKTLNECQLCLSKCEQTQEP